MSWAVSGLHGGSFHSNGKTVTFGRSWKEGDVITCIASVSAAGLAALSFYLNGDCIGTAADGVSVVSGLAPALSLAAGFVGEVCFDKTALPTMLDNGTPVASLQQWLTTEGKSRA